MTRRHYRFLRFDGNVDWQDVNPVLLARVNRLGMAIHKVITIVSGARGVAGHPNMGASHSHHVPGNNPSGRGEAVDAYVDGKPLGSVVSNRTAEKYGLFSGNRPGFYQGKPDPEHFETVERRGGSYKGGPPADLGAAPAASQPAAAPAAADPMADVIPDQSVRADTAPAPESSVAGFGEPGSTGPNDFGPRQTSDTWQLIASQPLASPESQANAQRALLAAGG